MVDIEQWVRDLTQKLWEAFGERVEFIGLQGSYARGEATEDSDIDLVVILDALSVEDLRIYRKIVRSMPDADKACGFICGTAELRKWPGYDLFHLYYDTTALYGYLEELLPPVCREDAEQAVRIGAANLYHMACNGYLFGDPARTLEACYKSAFFIMRAVWFARTGEFIKTKGELLLCTGGLEGKILRHGASPGQIDVRDSQQLDEAFAELIEWSGSLIKN